MVRVSSGPTEDHEFYTLGAEGFEMFARALHGAQSGVFNTSGYGTSGFKQYGADHVAFYRNADKVDISVGQSKAYKEFEQDGIRKAVDKFLAHWESHWKGKCVKRFVLFVGCRIRKVTSADEIIAQTQVLAALGIIFEVWDATEIYMRLSTAPHVVRLHLGLGWLEHLFGPAASPISSIVQDLARGGLGAFGAAQIVGELNRAEEARISELRRRIRRGDVASARGEINQALAVTTVGALTNEVRAGLLRLSAAMNVVRGDPRIAKAELDEADGLDGGQSARQRAMLCTVTLGPERTVAGDFDLGDPEVAEVVAAAHLRLGDHAQVMATLRLGMEVPYPSAETLRIAAVACLLSGDREAAVGYARRSVKREPDSRACQHLLAVSLFLRSITPAFELYPSDWPIPVDQAFVLDTDQAQGDVAEACEILTELADDPDLADHREMMAWSFATRACIPMAKPSAEEVLKRLLNEDRLIGPIVAWCLARGLPLRIEDAAAVIDREREADPADCQLILMDLAVKSQRKDRTGARSLLEQQKATLIADGLERYVGYWSSVLDMDEGRKAPQEALDGWPWLALRAAMTIRYKPRRLKEVARIAEDAAAPGGDPRILFATIQILVDASYSGTAAKFVDALIDRIGTAEAITLAVHVLSRAGMHERALAALADAGAFSGRSLPDDLERIRIRSNAALGRLVQAAQDLTRLATITGSPTDIWTSIEWNLAVGEVGGARDLYVRHQHALTVPTTGHLHLANAIICTDPGLAGDITRQLVASAPDALVTAIYDLTTRLRLADSQRGLMRRIQLLGARGEAGVELITDISVVIKRMQDARKQADETYERYCNGHVAMQMLPNVNLGGIAQQYLGNLIDPPGEGQRPAPLHARYGRRYDEAIWPSERQRVSIVMDLTALLTAHGLGILDNVERAFACIRLAPDIINVITHIRQSVSPRQPDRLDAAKRVVRLAGDGRLPDPADRSPVDTFRVTWELGDHDRESTLNLPVLLGALASSLEPGIMEGVRERFGEVGRSEEFGPCPPTGATVILDSGIAIELHLAGALDAALQQFDLSLPKEEIYAYRSEIESAERDGRLAEALEKLTKRLAEGAKEGVYEFVPLDPKAPTAPITRQFFQCIRSMETLGSILWVDDRFTTAIDNPSYPTVTTVEVLDALRRFDRLDAEAVRTARLRLRSAGWTFMPADGTEIASIVLACTRAGDVHEDDRLTTLRRSTAWTLLERRRLQWPNPEQAEAEVMGEIPFLLDQGHAVVESLVAIWSDQKVTDDDAMASSSWNLEYLDVGGRPPTVIPAGDPRSEFLAGLHIGHLISLAIQITPVRNNSARKTAYIEWLWGEVIGIRLRTCPEMMSTVLETLERTLVENEIDDPQQRRIWHAFCLDVVNALPQELRDPLLDRPALREAYDISQRGTISTRLGEFDASDYLKAIIELEPHREIRLKTTKGRKARFRLIRSGGESSVSVTVRNRSCQIDDWPRRMGSDDEEVRRAALQEQVESLDLMPSALDSLACELATASPADRALKVVLLCSETMSGWFSQLAGKLRSRKPIRPSDMVPQNLGPAFVRLQLDGRRGVAEAQACTIEAVGFEEALRRWSGVPIEPSRAFRTAVDARSDEQLLHLVQRVAAQSPAWTRLFVAKLTWERGRQNTELGALLRDVAIKSLVDEHSENEWELLTAIARFLPGDLGTGNGWQEWPIADRLAMLWSHAAELASHFLGARLQISGLVDFIDGARLVSPRVLLQDNAGFNGDVANPQDVFSRRLRIHSAGALLAEMAADEATSELARNATSTLLLEMKDGMMMIARRAFHGELTHLDALGSHLAVDVGPHLEKIFGDEIPYLAPKIGPFLLSLIKQDDPNVVRYAWVQLRSAMGHGRLPDEISDAVSDAMKNAPIVTTKEAVINDLNVLLSIAAIAAANTWSDMGEFIDTAYARLRDTTEKGEQITSLMFEIAFNRAWMERLPERRIEVLSANLEALRTRADMAVEVLHVAERFADAMSGSHAQPFIDIIARSNA